MVLLKDVSDQMLGGLNVMLLNNMVFEDVVMLSGDHTGLGLSRDSMAATFIGAKGFRGINP